MNLQNRKILILGCKGQLGSYLSLSLSKENLVRGLSREDCDFLNEINLENFVKTYNPSLIINCVAYTDVDKAEFEKNIVTKVNVDFNKIICKICNRNDIWLMHFSTDFVFKGDDLKPMKENEICKPINFYGESKRKGELVIMDLMKKYTILRLSGVYSNQANNFPMKIIQKLKENKEISVVDDQTASPTSVYFISNVVEIWIKKFFLSDKKNLSGLFHLSTTGYCSRYELAEKIKIFLSNYLVGSENYKIVPIKTTNSYKSAKRPIFSALNSEKLSNLLNYPFESWEYDINKFLNKFHKEFLK